MLRPPTARACRPPPQGFKREDRLPDLSPECRLITAKPFENTVIEIDEVQEAPRDVEPRIGRLRCVCCRVRNCFARRGVTIIFVAAAWILGLDDGCELTDLQCGHDRAVLGGVSSLRAPCSQGFALDLKKTGLNQSSAPQSP
jgi:hypothetical protein